MSPESRGRKPKSRSSRIERRRAAAREARGLLPDQLLRTMMSNADELLEPDVTVFDAESMVSSLLGSWWGKSLVDADPDEVFGEALIDHAAQQATPAALALLLCLAEVGPDRARVKASHAAEQVRAGGVPVPAWAASLGTVEPDSCFLAEDVTGDGSSLILTFRYADQEPHALVVFIDHNLGDIAKDTWAAIEGSEVVERWRAGAEDDPEMEFSQIEPARARAIAEHALVNTDAAFRPPVSDEFSHYRALTLTRVRLLPYDPEIVAFPDNERVAIESLDDDEQRRALALPPIEPDARAQLEAEDLDPELLDPHDPDHRQVLIERAHPEHAQALEQGQDEVHGSSAGLHLALHQVIAGQIMDGDPSETLDTGRRLLASGYDAHNLQHALMFALSEPMRKVLVEQREFDVAEYIAALDLLPESWRVAVEKGGTESS
ncbi:MAG: DUF1841 family protein [Propionibacteriales bacterium]|nr:DUF1841 family protein [Propionibacteriales bacterium]